MVLLVAWVADFAAGLAWRLGGPRLSLFILICAAAALPAAASFWTPRARRKAAEPAPAPFVDLQRRRISEVDMHVREQVAAGLGVAQIAASAAWLNSEGSTRAEPR